MKGDGEIKGTNKRDRIDRIMDGREHEKFYFSIIDYFYIINTDIEYINNPVKSRYNETKIT